MFNHVILIGRLTEDPNISFAEGETVAKFNLVYESLSGEPGMIQCVAVDRQAEDLMILCPNENSKLIVIGSLEGGKWGDEECVYRNVPQIIVSSFAHVQFG